MTQHPWMHHPHFLILGLNFRTLDTLVKPLGVKRLAREQEPNEKSVLSIAVCLWVVVHSSLIQLPESFLQIAKCTIDIM
jgi:hypothetical protein